MSDVVEDPPPGSYSWDEYRAMFDRLSDHVEDWQGVPVILPEMPLTLHSRHPLRDAIRQIEGVPLNIVCGGPTYGDDDYVEEVVVNEWVSRRENARVYVFHRRGVGVETRAFAVKVPLPPDGAMNRLNFWLRTIGVSDAWDLAAERQARFKLSGMLSERQWRHYELTGSFIETSPRSRLTYVFRRLRPTIAMSPRNRRPDDDMMRCIAVLCLHPIGYYEETWGGCLVPTDDVIAHLAHMRADEAGFWRTANQHDPASPNAGL